MLLRRRKDSMREIKFRAWDKKKKKMYEVRSLHNIHSGINVHADLCNPTGGYGTNEDAVISNHYSVCDHQDSFIYLQYTGLHDKNGQEIYEGDIVRFDLYKGERVDVIEWENIANHTSFGGGTHNATVIGNIYENPDLLK